MSMSHEALTLRASLIRLQTVIGLMLETGVTVTEEHMQELTKYMGELGFVNESCLLERVISLLNTGAYESKTRPAPGTELGDAMHAAAVRSGEYGVAGLANAAKAIKRLTQGKDYVRSDFNQHLQNDNNSKYYTFDDPKSAVEKIKDLLARGFIQGSIQWPTARKLAAAMATNGVRLIINAKGDPKYIYSLDLSDDTGFVLLKIEDLAGNVLHDAPVMDLMHLGSRNWETPVKEMALELINSAGPCSFADCQAVENELAKKFTTEYLDHKLKGFKMAGVQAFKYANTGRPFFMVTVTAEALEQPTMFPVYMD